MAGVSVKFHLDGVQPILSRLKSIKESVRNKYLRRALSKASRVVRKAARGKIKDGRDGKLNTIGRALEVKVVVKDNKAYAIVGVDRKKIKEAGLPSNVDALVEFGHQGPTPAPAHPFLRPAYEETKGQVADIIKDELLKGLVTEAGKGN